MTVPSLHLNGTNSEALETQVRDAYEALRVSLEEPAEASPNGRDCDAQGPDALYNAQNEHRARRQKVQDVMKELTMKLPSTLLTACFRRRWLNRWHRLSAWTRMWSMRVLYGLTVILASILAGFAVVHAVLQ